MSAMAEEQPLETQGAVPAKPLRFVGRNAQTSRQPDGTSRAESAITPAASSKGTTRSRQVPADILENEQLNQAIAVLPTNYNFEVHKTIWRAKQLQAKVVSLQFPEGLQMYACTIADILERFANVEHVVVLGDVTYGACCIDDYAAQALSSDLLVHYGHSCLVPVNLTLVPTMYVFVDIKVDTKHLVETIRRNFEPGTNVALAGTIQFASSIQEARQQLAPDFPNLAVPQTRPLSPGEVLGCTAPVLPPLTDAILFVADGRFHLEAIMIANPAVPAYRYDPYARVLSREHYDHAGMRVVRKAFVEVASSAMRWGCVLGTLGRQGNPQILQRLESVLRQKGMQFFVVLLSELSPAKLQSMQGVDAWVQIACPRLSIDWGEGFKQPTLTPYEALVALGEVEPWWVGSSSNASSTYPMDYYAKDGGPWGSTYALQASKTEPGKAAS